MMDAFSFMRMMRAHIRAATVLTLTLSAIVACNRDQTQAAPDKPRLTANVTLQDVTFYSPALRRNSTYRAIYPAHIPNGLRLPVVYLLHGGGGNYRDWSNYSDVAAFAEKGLILVMPDGDDSYYTNATARPNDRYEDFIVNDLIADVENRFPAARDRNERVIAGVSMGGFGAIKLGLKYPGLFGFIGGLSSAIDVPSRPFSIRRIGQWRHHESIFGPWKSDFRRNNDPFVLALRVDPNRVGYLFLTCGTKEGLLPSNRKFSTLLNQRHFQFEFHVVPGGHDWIQWNAQLPALFGKLLTLIKGTAD